jgi:glycosyltransferase involved in cell wall biosynthesis
VNLYDSAEIGGLDLAQLAAATDHPRILFVTNDVLGWRTFGDELARATRDRDDLYAVHLHFHDVRSTLRKLADRRVWRGQELRHAHGAVVRARANQLARTLEAPNMTDAFDAIHVSPHLLALGIVRSRWHGPLSVIFDADVRKAKEQRQALTGPQFERQFRHLHTNEGEVIRRANRLWAMSQWAADHMAAEYRLDPTTITIIPPVRSVTARTWDAPTHDGPVRIAFVGNDLERKGCYRLIQWHQDRWTDTAELHIFTATPRPKRDLPGVIWHQRVDNRVLVSEHLKSMDFFVLPTTSDMSPFAVTEAVAAGLPVVSSAIGGIGELVHHNTSGILCDPTDDNAYITAVQQLIDNPDLRQRMGQAALAIARTTLNPRSVMTTFIDGILELAR